MASLVSFTATQASDNHGNSSNSHHSHLRKSGPNYPHRNFKSSHDESHSRKFASQSSNMEYCTLESSLTTSFSSASESQESGDNSENSVSDSCVTEDLSDLKGILKELESVMLGPETDVVDSFGEFNLLAEIPNGDLKHVLIDCAKAIAEDNLTAAEWLVTELRYMVSVSGEPIQRLGAYMLEGLIARVFSSGSAICKSLKCKEPSSSELLSYMHILFEICPLFKCGYMSGNGAIVEAVKDEDKVHIIDFQITQGHQWLFLIQALASRPGGPPHLRITGIDDPVSAFARGGGLHIVGQRLSQFAESFKVPFEFHPAIMTGCEPELKHTSFNIRPGEALVVNFAFCLHHLPDESVTTSNYRDRLLRFVKSLAPKVMTVIEQESNMNTAAFLPRFLEALDYYNAVFEAIDVTLPRESKERINVEQHCLAGEIVNIIACEGAERVERHEVHGKWKSRLRMAGFMPCPMSPPVNGAIKLLLENYCKKFKLEERDGAVYLGWMHRALVVCSAWK